MKSVFAERFSVHGGRQIDNGQRFTFIQRLDGQITVYGIDPATGALTSQSQAAADITTNYSIAAQGNFVYDVAKTSAGGYAIYGFPAAQNGSLSAVPGLPVSFGQSCDLCANPEFDSISLDAKYLAIGSGNGHAGAGGFDLFARQSNGGIQRVSGAGSSSIISISLHPSDTLLYEVQAGDDGILVFRIDSNGQTTGIQDYLPPSDDFAGVLADPSGNYVLATSRFPNPTVVAFRPNSDGTIGTEVGRGPTSPTPSQLTFDPSGHWVIAQDSAELTVLSFNPATGALSKTGSASGAVAKPAVASF